MAVRYEPAARGLFSYTEHHFLHNPMRDRVFMAAAHLALAHEYIVEEDRASGRATLADVETLLRGIGSAIHLVAGPLHDHGAEDVYLWIPAGSRGKYGPPKYGLHIASEVELPRVLSEVEMSPALNQEALQYTGMPDLQLPPRFYARLLSQQLSRQDGIRE